MQKVTRILQRADGSEVRITAEPYAERNLEVSTHVYVHFRSNPSEPWQLASDRPHPDWRTMPRDDYIKYGRSKMLQLVSHGEIFSVSNEALAGDAPPFIVMDVSPALDGERAADVRVDSHRLRPR
ncbi:MULTISPECIES: hypothetical protein [Achromobacter]|uniref:hypothetical protein n=1 Tax=Achromobacter TaxID=222 RepID=UPI0023F9525D|nr:hypothetical protein [Achromobacter anxifer]MDF8363366.1 hypothetical protein [Achromobacter anxifer]